MSVIVLARFDSVASARSAAHALIADGFAEEAVSLFVSGSSAAPGDDLSLRGAPDLDTRMGRHGAAAAAAALAALGALAGAVLGSLPAWGGGMALVAAAAVAGAYAGALLGTLWMVAGLPWQVGGLGSGLFGKTFLVAVQVLPAGVPMAMALLRDAGGVHVAQSLGPWQAAAPERGQGGQRGQTMRVNAERLVAARSPNARHSAGPRYTQWQP